MSEARAIEMTEKLTAEGGPLHYDPEGSRLLLGAWRSVATGRPGIAILSVVEGYDIGGELVRGLVAGAPA